MSEQKLTLQILIDARKLIENESRWCPKGAYGPNGTICAAIALQKARAGLNLMPSLETEAYVALGNAMGVGTGEDDLIGRNLGKWNDSHTHPEVLAAFDRAIESERAKVTQ